MLQGKLEKVVLYRGKPPANAVSPMDAFMFSEVDTNAPILDSKGNKRSFYLYLPESGLVPCTSGVYIIRDGSDYKSAEKILEKTGWAERAERDHYIIILPNPTEAGWNVEDSPEGPDDYAFLQTVLTDGSTLFLLKGKAHRTSKYMAGFGVGATMAVGVCMQHGEMIAGLFAQEAKPPAVKPMGQVPVPAWLVNPATQVWQYFRELDIPAEFPVQRFDSGDRSLWEKAWDEIFLGLRRWPVRGTGVVLHKSTVEEMGLEAHSKVLGDNDGITHEWYEFTPSIHLVDPEKELPLLIGLHGGSTSAKYYAEQNRWHELGEKFGFFVVYPQSTLYSVWNAGCDTRFPSDEEFLLKLLGYLTEKYPVDQSRVYCTGFSMGSLMTQCMGMLHWDLFAAIAPMSGFLFDAYWQGPEVSEMQPYALTKKREAKLQFSQGKSKVLPLVKFYGTADKTWSFPPVQKTRDFWSRWNNVPTIDTSAEPTQVRGYDKRFSVWDSLDESDTCLFRYISVQDISHAVDLRQPYLAWEFMSRYSRNEQSGQLQIE